MALRRDQQKAIFANWKKIINTNDKMVWQNKKTPNIKLTMRLNRVTRKFQLFKTDGMIETKDFGNFGLRQENLVKQKAHNYLSTHNR